MCDQDLRPLFDQHWLRGNVADRIFTLAGPRDLIDYFSRAGSIGSLFSYMSSIVVKRAAWNTIDRDNRLAGSNYAHVGRLFSILRKGGTLKYIREPLVLCRGDNDSFSKSGVVRRFMIDIDGYLLLADTLFPDMDVRRAFLAVMRREHPWYVYAELRSRISDPGAWREFKRKLLAYGYSPGQLSVVGVLGSLPPVMAIARLCWFTLKRFRTVAARVMRNRQRSVPATQA